MRDADRPEEVLEEEDVTLSLPRRFGLSDVVGAQIRHLEEEARRGRRQSTEMMEDLIRLVIRRPDADEVFSEAGIRVARWDWENRAGLVRGSVRFMPRPAAALVAARAARRLFKQMLGEGRLSVGSRPPTLRITRSITAAGDPGGAACAFYTGAFTELLRQYTGRAYRAQHTRCETGGADACEWTTMIGVK